MSYPRIFERVYCTPVAVTAESFRSIDAVLRPRLLGRAPMPSEDKQAIERELQSGPGRKQRPRATLSLDGKQVTDPRLYALVAPGIAAVPAKGVFARNVSPLEEAFCGMVGYESITAALLQANAAAEVNQIILDVDSPGGECIGCFELADIIASLDKPVYGFTEGLACSAAYCLISQCEEVYATRSAFLGSIGVLCAVLDDSGNLAADGFKMDYFTAGANKLAFGGSGYTLNDSDRKITQDRVDYYYAMFASTVQSGRGKPVEEIAPLAQKSAQIYVGQQAVDAGLCDDIVSGFDELVQLVAGA